MKKWITSLVLGCVLALFLVACGGGEETKETIKLVANPWPASELNVAVAEIIIEKELGNPVEILALDENVQWDALASGDADASLEVWPSGHGERIQQYITEQNLVVDGGPLGPQGVIGWYIPKYVLEAHPELASWEGLKNPETAKLFATAETGENGRFLAGDPSWTQYDADIIKNLQLPLQVVTAGSEDALLAEVSSAYNNQKPVLFYFYAPHAIFSRFELVEVPLPAHTEECYAQAEAGGVACAYPADALMKIFSPKLEAKDAAVFAFLKNMSYTNADQIEMLGTVDGGASIQDAAQAWVTAHEEVWRAWLPAGE